MEDCEQAASLTGGPLRMRMQKKGDWSVDLLDDSRKLTRSGWHALELVDNPEGRFIH
ncbi:MAG TPA: hypothetical protein VH186_07955 [Chloroflexia bacterium]|nr:hypothetical protein [Chloroflexia bacterium]